MKYFTFAIVALWWLNACVEQTITVPTNGALIGYSIYKGDRLICNDPQVWNQFRGGPSAIVCPSGPANPAYPPLAVSLPSSGLLRGYVVQDAQGGVICRHPLVKFDTHKNLSFIFCPEST